MGFIEVGALILLITWILRRHDQQSQNYAEDIFLGDGYEKVDPVLDLARKHGISIEQETKR